jgi:hypothetical protein
MITPYQRYEATVKFSFESEVFPGDPDDVFELAELEKDSIESIIRASFDNIEIGSIKVEPITIVTA